MNIVEGQIQVQSFLTVTLGILVLFLGKALNRRFAVLREFTIPEPVSGGLLVALVITLLHLAFGLDISFGLRARDLLLVYFFTTVGMNASFADLRRGGRALVVLLVLTILLMLAQNLLGMALAQWGGLPAATGLLMGTVSLIGGHGTTIAWAPKFAADYGVPNALEIGVAAATFGLILASASGGPIARFLIQHHRLVAPGFPPAGLAPAEQEPLQGPPRQGRGGGAQIDSHDFLKAVLAINICIILGSILQEVIRDRGLFLPLFVRNSELQWYQPENA
ncbi:MAG: sodium/glutamate symporter, partial [Cyanobium sp.]